MPRRSRPSSDPNPLLDKLRNLLDGFERRLFDGAELRPKVKALIPAYYALRDLGSSLLQSDAGAARDRVLQYLRLYPMTVIHGDELMVISGIGEWARRLRELRVQFGWQIYSGTTFKEIAADDESSIKELAALLGRKPQSLKPDEYVLVDSEQDREAALRWNMINTIRRKRGYSVKDKIIEYLNENIGDPVTGEELRYLANNKSEWARRTRELRTEDGWLISTRQTGRPDLKVGQYVLDSARQTHVHDRKIPDNVRVEVLTRDSFKCRICGWGYADAKPKDPRRFLELHHVKQHKDKGDNTAANLSTLCNVHHDALHANTLTLDQLARVSNN